MTPEVHVAVSIPAWRGAVFIGGDSDEVRDVVGRRRYFDPLYDAVVIDKHPRGNNKVNT